jgi:S1-C subfamily serine protease
VVAALIVALALISAGYLVGQAQRGEAELGAPTSTTHAGAAPAPSIGDEPVVAVADALGPAVVQIRTTGGVGSGIIYDADGLIVTNAHVVGSATDVGVTLSSGAQLSGQVLGTDAAQDIAVIRVDPGANRLVAAQLATVPPRVGALTVAIGSPFGLRGTVTSGVVSAVDRPLDQQAVDQQPVDPPAGTVKLIQTDAPINPGNSGGALADIHGQVIGVNAGLVSRSGDNNGIGFAIPIATAMAAATRITEGG